MDGRDSMLALDHIVVAAKDPEQSAKAFAVKHNVQTLQGGKHENWGTYNYLAYFANNCYMEWLGIYDKNKAMNAENPLVHQLITVLEKNQEVPFQFAFRTKNMNKHVKHFEKNAIPFIGPFDGSRRKPNGSMLEWKMLFPMTDKENFYPFIIEWGETINLPDQHTLINSQQLPSIVLNLKMKAQIQDTYQLHVDDNKIQLDNCTFSFSDKIENLELKIETI